MNLKPTLVLSPRYTTDSIALSKAASSAGWSVERLVRWQAPNSLKEHHVVLYGEPFFAAAIAEQLSLKLIEPSFDWLTTLPTEYVKRRIHFGTLGEARGLTESAFIKPADDKCFMAQVYQTGTELPATEHLPQETPVLISGPVDWEVEFRGFVLDNELKTLSPYFRHGNLAQTDAGDWPTEPAELSEAADFYASLLRDDKVSLPSGVVVDIGKIAGRGWAVVEANPAWSSGIYGCDPMQVLQVIEKTCVKQSQISEQQREWIIHRTA